MSSSSLQRLSAVAHLVFIGLVLLLGVAAVAGAAVLVVTEPELAGWLVFLVPIALVLVPWLVVSAVLGQLWIKAGRPGGFLWSAAGWLGLAASPTLELIGGAPLVVSVLKTWLPVLMAGVAVAAWWVARARRRADADTLRA